MNETINYYWLHKALIDFAALYVSNPNKDISNDAHEFLQERIEEDNMTRLINYE